MIRVSNRWNDEEEVIIKKLRSYRVKMADYQACKELYDTMFPSGTQTLTDMPKGGGDTFEPERWAMKRWDQSERMQQSLNDMREEYLKIEGIINTLDGYYRIVVLRRYIFNESYEEIAEKIHCHRNTAKQWHDRAIERLVKNCVH